MATRLRTAAVLLTTALLVAACSWGDREPGLFTTPVPSVSPARSPGDAVSPDPTDPRLPVVGEALWTTADGLGTTVRLAVHAVRRTATATVLDWSVTPIPAPGHDLGQTLPPGTDLGLDATLVSTQNLALLDPGTDRAYRPLSQVSPAQPSGCLCTPLAAVVPQLRYGETRLLQLAFGPLPVTTTRVDVALPNVALVPGVPVTPEGRAPYARTPTDLARPAVAGNAVTGAKLAPTTGGTGDRQTVVVNRIVASRGLTSIVWTLSSVDDQASVSRAEPPVTNPLPARARLTTEVPADGPRLRVPGRDAAPTGARWTTASVAALPAYACLCSGLATWSRGLLKAGGSAHLTTLVGPLPAGTTRVDVLFPGLDAFTDVHVSRAGDAPDLPTGPVEERTWTYDEQDPPPGWTSQEWPTPVPAADQAVPYSGRTEQILPTLPRS